MRPKGTGSFVAGLAGWSGLLQPAQAALNYLLIAAEFAVVCGRQTKIHVNQSVDAGRRASLSCADYNDLWLEDVPAPPEIV